MISLTAKGSGCCCISNFKTKRVKNLGPWKLMENFLILVPHCGK